MGTVPLEEDEVEEVVEAEGRGPIVFRNPPQRVVAEEEEEEEVFGEVEEESVDGGGRGDARDTKYVYRGGGLRQLGVQKRIPRLRRSTVVTRYNLDELEEDRANREAPVGHRTNFGKSRARGNSRGKGSGKVRGSVSGSRKGTGRGAVPRAEEEEDEEQEEQVVEAVIEAIDLVGDEDDEDDADNADNADADGGKDAEGEVAAFPETTTESHMLPTSAEPAEPAAEEQCASENPGGGAADEEEGNAVVPEQPPEFLFYYPPRARGKIRVTSEELHRLEKNLYLNDSIIDFYVKYLETRESTHIPDSFFLSSFFFGRLRATRPIDYNGVARWTTNVDLFQKCFVFVPICDSYHWSMIVVANLNNLEACMAGEGLSAYNAQTPEQRPQIIYMDSLDPRRGADFGDIMRQYLVSEWLNRKQQEEVTEDLRKTTLARFKKLIRTVKAHVPVQNNEYDCGLYLLINLSYFLRNVFLGRDKILAKGHRAQLAKLWYSHAEVEELRYNIIHLITYLRYRWIQRQKKVQSDVAGEARAGDVGAEDTGAGNAGAEDKGADKAEAEDAELEELDTQDPSSQRAFAASVEESRRGTPPARAADGEWDVTNSAEGRDSKQGAMAMAVEGVDSEQEADREREQEQVQEQEADTKWEEEDMDDESEGSELLSKPHKARSAGNRASRRTRGGVASTGGKIRVASAGEWKHLAPPVDAGDDSMNDSDDVDTHRAPRDRRSLVTSDWQGTREEIVVNEEMDTGDSSDEGCKMEAELPSDGADDGEAVDVMTLDSRPSTPAALDVEIMDEA